MKKVIKIFLFPISYIFNISLAHAHEAYVLDKNYFWSELQKPPSSHALDALKDPGNIYITSIIVGSILLLFAVNFFFRESPLGKKVHRGLERFSWLGPIFVRIAIAAAFFFSAAGRSFLGPELPVQSMPLAQIIRIALFIISFLIAVGLFTEIAALAALIIFTVGFITFGTYIFTYLNYLGEIVVLLLFGMRKWSFDRLIFGKFSIFSKWKKYETTIVRIFYGAALIYAGITVKFLHPLLTIKVINDWNLTQFHWLFPSDPLLVALGAGLAEVAIGLFIIIGFEMRLVVFISLIYITLSLLYFRELVWPHLMLYGISLNLILQREVFTVDHLLFKEKRWQFWKRPLTPHPQGDKIA